MDGDASPRQTTPAARRGGRGALWVGALLCAVALCGQAPPPAARPAAANPAGTKLPTMVGNLEITADLIDFFWEKRLVVFTGHVHAHDERMAVHADKMTMLLNEQHQAQLIEADGTVTVEREGAKITSGKARFDVPEGLITLSDKPVIEQAGNRVVGAEEVVLNRKESRFFTRGGRPLLTILQKPGTELGLPLPPPAGGAAPPAPPVLAPKALDVPGKNR